MRPPQVPPGQRELPAAELAPALSRCMPAHPQTPLLALEDLRLQRPQMRDPSWDDVGVLRIEVVLRILGDGDPPRVPREADLLEDLRHPSTVDLDLPAQRPAAGGARAIR